ncbi:MAG: hypothetical protein OEX22_00995 [Cyclobacteriaceae bacterium]|nr:hypothetical protein [Cyclobacteriaceae bacterium]
MKNILVVNYSQTGQLNDILNNITQPLQHHTIEVIRVSPRENFPFPWTGEAFFNAMPETVLEEPIELSPILFKRDKYDLVIFGYQPWFLSPSLPATSILKNKSFAKVIKGTPVITVIGARNMWLNAQESVKTLIHESGGKLVANIPLIDRNNNLVSALTIMHWMFGGEKTKKWGMLPKPGIIQEDIDSSCDFGEIINVSIDENEYHTLQEKILELDRIIINTNILFIEERAKKLFKIWANLIKSKGLTTKKRKFWVTFFKYYLIFALFVVSPIVLFVFNILVKPFIMNSLQRKKDYFCSVNLNTKNA